MPIFMDLHIVPGATPKEVAEAHRLDLNIQDEFCCKTMTYWIDESRGNVFCLIEAPHQDAVKELHKKAHGLIPHEIIEVSSSIVESFLGRISDPETHNQPDDKNVRVFSDPAFRIILFSQTMDSRLLQLSLGKEKSQELLQLYNTTLHDQIMNFEGRKVESSDSGIIISFVSVNKAVECALAIQNRLDTSGDLIGLRLGLHAGVPVNKSHEIFGTTINLARYLCTLTSTHKIIISSIVRDFYKEGDNNDFAYRGNVRCLTSAEECFLETLVNTLDENWQNPQFGVPDFCIIMSISKAQLYRKSIATTGKSPNSLLREYRLLKSLNMLRHDVRNIAQTTFDTGFSSPSYFTKCFQKRFGLQPQAYVKIKE